MDPDTIIRTDDLDTDEVTCPKCHGTARLVHRSTDARCTNCGHQDDEERFLLPVGD